MINFVKSKKAQYYIVSAVLLCSLAVGMISSYSTVSKEQLIFDQLRSNFLKESPIAVNGIIGSGNDLFSNYDDFVSKYLDYALSRNVDFDLIYLIQYNNTFYFKNYFDSAVEVRNAYNFISLNSSESGNFSATKDITITKNGVSYDFIFDEKDVQVKALFEISIK